LVLTTESKQIKKNIPASDFLDSPIIESGGHVAKMAPTVKGVSCVIPNLLHYSGQVLPKIKNTIVPKEKSRSNIPNINLRPPKKINEKLEEFLKPWQKSSGKRNEE
jgi:hypothetical protein